MGKKADKVLKDIDDVIDELASQVRRPTELAIWESQKRTLLNSLRERENIDVDLTYKGVRLYSANPPKDFSDENRDIEDPIGEAESAERSPFELESTS